MIGPLSGDESIAVANYAKQHPDEDVRRRRRRRAGHDAEGAGAELLPLQRRRRAVERRPRRPRLQQARLEDGGGRRGRLQLRVDVGGGLHRRVLRGRRQRHEAGLPAARTRPTTRRTRSSCRPNVDGTFVAVGGAGLIPFLKAYEQAHGPIDGKKFIGNLFWGTPGAVPAARHPRRRRLLRRRRHGRRPRHRGREGLRNSTVGKSVQDDPAVRRRGAAGVVDVHVRLLHQHLGPDQGPEGRGRQHLRRPEGAPGRRSGR